MTPLLNPILVPKTPTSLRVSLAKVSLSLLTRVEQMNKNKEGQSLLLNLYAPNSKNDNHIQ
jgi:hypothetical protein